MNVLSVFDGMSCGQIALVELGFKIDKYYAAEIDKYAIIQTQHNFPNTIQLGSVVDVKAKDLEKIDLFIGGSPCQGFSFIGKQLNFNDPQSALFFEFVRLWREIKAINPNAVFLLENVNMKKEYLRVISEYLGVFPVRINSSLVSGQNRDRWYWSNIKTKDIGLFAELWTDIPQPKDKGIMLKDILESNVPDKYFLTSHKMINHVTDEWRLNKKYTQINGEKGLAQTARQYANWGGDYICVSKDNLLTNGYKLRKLTPIECARLQTIPEWYEWIVSDTQIYRMLGNGWTVEVIKHIFSFIKGFEKNNKEGQKNKLQKTK